MPRPPRVDGSRRRDVITSAQVYVEWGAAQPVADAPVRSRLAPSADDHARHINVLALRDMGALTGIQDASSSVARWCAVAGCCCLLASGCAEPTRTSYPDQPRKSAASFSDASATAAPTFASSRQVGRGQRFRPAPRGALADRRAVIDGMSCQSVLGLSCRPHTSRCSRTTTSSLSLRGSEWRRRLAATERTCEAGAASTRCTRSSPPVWCCWLPPAPIHWANSSMCGDNRWEAGWLASFAPRTETT